MDKKSGFEDFIAAVNGDNQEFVRELHHKLMERGCKLEVKDARSGYVVSYKYDKKTIANYVFRKKGLLIRIYAEHASQCTELLDTLPDGMVQSIQKASICKRLVNPDDCNPRCPMGYDFWLKGEHYQKCRSNAFMFLVCPENNEFIGELLLKEIKVDS